MIFATIWQRILALVVDTIVFLPLLLIWPTFIEQVGTIWY